MTEFIGKEQTEEEEGEDDVQERWLFFSLLLHSVSHWVGSQSAEQPRDGPVSPFNLIRIVVWL